MCDVCLKSPCDPRCPNAPEPEEITVYVCSGCSVEIKDGQYVYEFLGEQFCETCVDKARKIARAVE